ncbi:MAG: adenylate/guanylate cyclase domain-containing protein [Methyloceanibacter sp.]|jgi:class 3 adenylate cyclase
MRILIAEDEPISRRSLERQLGRWGHDVIAVSDGTEAWQAFEAGKFDIVVSDWDMPGVTGVELIRRIRAAVDQPFVYIIMLTSRTLTEDLVTGIDAGADDFLTKPFDKAELKVRLLAGERFVRLERDLTQRSEELEAAQNDIRALADKLSKYLSPVIYRSIFEGKQDASIATQRKKLTIFFSDIVDFTETSERLDPEDLASLLNEYLLAMTEIVIEYGGTLDKYIGDAILVFFGDPDSLGEEEDAYRCVAMAMAMQQRMRVLRERWKAAGRQRPFHVRMGITSGYCNVGNFGSDAQMSYTIIGRQVNLASRLESESPPDQILISNSTWALVKSRVSCARKEPVVVKGFAEPIEAYQVIGESEEQSDGALIEFSSPALSLRLDTANLQGKERETVVRELQHALSRIAPPD